MSLRRVVFLPSFLNARFGSFSTNRFRHHSRFFHFFNNRAFIPKTRKGTSYCDRIIRNGKTCKKIAPTIIHKIAVDTDPVLKAFERTKQEMYKRYERTTWTLEDLPKGISFKEYSNWRECASQAHDKYIKGEMTKEEALKIIEVKD